MSGLFVRACAVLALLCVLPSLGCSSKPASDTSSDNILVNGRRITPAGTTGGSVGDMPLNVVLSPDGKYAVTSSSCLDARLSAVRVRDGAVVGSLSFPAADPKIPNGGLFYGLVFDPTPRDGKYVLYAAQGAYGTVVVVTLASDGTLTKTGTIPAKPIPYMPVDQPAGIALANGVLFMANYFSVDLKAAYQPASTLSMYRARDGARLGSYTFADGTATNTPSFPYAVVARSDGKRAYVASQRDGCVYVLDTTHPDRTVLLSKIANLSHPSALLLNKAQTLLYIANAGSDTISVADVTNDHPQAKKTILLRPTNVANLPGVSPSGLALSPDERTLYASLGDFNAVGVVDAVNNQLRGYIPAGWYPTALTTAEQGRVLYVVNGWGTSARNPNPHFNYLNPDVVGINSSVMPPSWVAPPGPGYVLNSIPGNVTRIEMADAMSNLDALTARTIENNQNTSAMGSTGDKTLKDLSIKADKIKHVIYVVKENRGYDQVLGDLPQGNGDPSLTLYGREVTPNQHALAERFILLDNFYNNAPVSGEGWVWCTQSLANAYTIKAIPYVYQLSLPTYQINYGFEGQVNGYITGGYPAKDQDGNWLSPTHEAAPSIPNVTESPGGFIWDAVREAGLSYRNYGFFLSSGAPSKPPYDIPDNYPTVAGLAPPGHIPTPQGQVAGNSDYDFRKFDFGFADSDAWVKHGLDAAALGLTTGNPPGYYASSKSPVPPQPSRYSEWNREFQHMLKQDPSGDAVPAFMTVRLGRDHTMGLNPGFNSPRAMMADNDYAVGQLVEAVSKSPIWESTAIFVVEDDAQFSNDHVDAHRSFVQVISPWIKKSTVDSRFYDTNSVLKSMELLLGLPAMSQYDHFANPILGGWDSSPGNDAAYEAILPSKEIVGEVNPKLTSYAPGDSRRRLAELSSGIEWGVADAAPYRVLNEILWKDAKGTSSAVPALRASGLRIPGVEEQEDDDDD